MPDATPRSARWVQSPDDIPELVELITDPERTKLVVGVTTQPTRERPLVDADELAARLGDQADVWVLTDPGHAWELTDSLPPKIDVYGGAVRAWNPIKPGKDPYPSDHPQWTVFGPEDAERIVDQIVEYAKLSDNPPPEFGSVVRGTVTGVRQAGAEIDLETGHPAFASLAHLVQHGEVFHAGDVLMPGMQVNVRVGAWHPQAGRVSVSLRDFAPNPWRRIADVYEPGMLVEGGVSGVTDFGAFIELLPGAEGLLHRSKIADAYVEYVDDYVRPGDRITVRLLSIDPRARKAEVSLIDVDPDEAPVPPASIYPDGPPWLPAVDAPAASAESETQTDSGSDTDSDDPASSAGEPETTGELPHPADGVLEHAAQAAVDAFDARLAELGASEAQAAAWSGRLRAALAGLSEAD